MESVWDRIKGQHGFAVVVAFWVRDESFVFSSQNHSYFDSGFDRELVFIDYIEAYRGQSPVIAWRHIDSILKVYCYSLSHLITHFWINILALASECFCRWSEFW